MMRLLHLGVAMLALPLCARTASAELTVTHIAHSGFLLTDGHKKVLVDALTYPSPRWKFSAPSAELREKMEQGQPPFDGVGLLLITHAHSDHFAPPPTVNFLLHNPKAVALATPEARDLMKKWVPDYAKVAERVIVPELEWKQSTTLELGGVRVEVSRLKHGDDGQWACILYSFLFDLGGKKILYAAATDGHFPEEYRELGWAKRGIDLAFLCGSMLGRLDPADGSVSARADGIEMVRTLISPKITVMMHVIPDLRPAAEKITAEQQKQLPGLIFFKELESRTF
jgi:L-ascorbate metabolism protein UlaG (beta-lactamase superfamily)